jgi:hypothetical protein
MYELCSHSSADFEVSTVTRSGMAPAETICVLLSADEVRCHSAPVANFCASGEPPVFSIATSGLMAPASTTV